MFGRGLHVRAPTWDPSGDQTRCPTYKLKKAVRYNIQKQQLFEKLGSLTIGEGPDYNSTATKSVAPVETHHAPAKSHELKIKSRHHLVPIAVLAGFFIAAGALAGVFYTTAHQSFASITVAGIPVKADASPTEIEKEILSAAKTYKVKVKYIDGKVKSFGLAETGVTVDAKKSAQQAKEEINSSVIRRVEWWKPIKTDLVVKKDDAALYEFVTKHVTQVKSAPTDATLVINNGVASITPEAEGSGSTVKFAKTTVATNVGSLKDAPIVLKLTKLTPAIKTKDLEKSKAKANTLLAKPVSFAIAGHNVSATPVDIGNWLDISPVPNSKTVDVTVNSGKVLQYIDKVARRYITPPHSRLVTSTDGGQVVLDPGSDGVDVVNKEKTASEIAKKVASDPSVKSTLAVQFTPAKTIETQAYDKWFVADVTTKRMYAYEKTKLVRTFLISAGAPATPTVIGTYKIYAKYRSQTMSGFNADGSRYRQPDVPYVNYFTGGYAIHGNYWRPASYFGNINSSHGCIGINPTDAAWIYGWAPIGTTVITHK